MMSTPETTTEKTRGLTKSREGRVVSNKMDQTVTVAVERMFQHPRYKKYVRHTSKLKAHDITASMSGMATVTTMRWLRRCSKPSNQNWYGGPVSRQEDRQQTPLADILTASTIHGDGIQR